MENDQQLQELEHKLLPFPNFFQIDLKDFDRKYLENVLHKKEQAMRNVSTDRTGIEKQRYVNLKAFLFYKLGKKDDAEMLIDSVLEDTTWVNVNACAMMALMCYRKGKYSQCERIMEELKMIQQNQQSYPIDVAWEEMAYVYATFGVQFYDKAIELYKNVISRQEDQHPEACYIWKFGLALALRRCFTSRNLRSLYPPPESDEICSILKNIISNCEDNTYVSWAHMEYADLVSNHSREVAVIEYHVNESLKRIPDDHKLLNNAGKVWQRIYRFNQAERCLRKSLEICETEQALHQLALLLKGQLASNYIKCSRMQDKTPPTSCTALAGPTQLASMQAKSIKFPSEPMRGVCKRKDHELWKECISLFERSLKMSAETNLLGVYELGRAYLLWNPPMYDQALEQFRKAFDSDTPFARCKAYYMAGRCLYYMSQDDKLEEDIREEHRRDALKMETRAKYFYEMCTKDYKN